MRKVIKMFRLGKVTNMFQWLKEHRLHLRKSKSKTPKKGRKKTIERPVNHNCDEGSGDGVVI